MKITEIFVQATDRVDISIICGIFEEPLPVSENRVFYWPLIVMVLAKLITTPLTLGLGWFTGHDILIFFRTDSKIRYTTLNYALSSLYDTLVTILLLTASQCTEIYHDQTTNTTCC